MKLRNKDDGRIREFGIDETKSFPYYLRDELGNTYWAKTFKEIADKWEDLEEPKKYYVINPVDWAEVIGEVEYRNDSTDKINKEIGNYFETKEEAEKAVEKLKAFKRLKDKGFRFKGYTDDSGDLFSCQVIRCSFDDFGKESRNDLDLLFGGEK